MTNFITYILLNDIIDPVSRVIIKKSVYIIFNGYRNINGVSEFMITDSNGLIKSDRIFHMNINDVNNSILTKSEYLTQKINVLINSN